MNLLSQLKANLSLRPHWMNALMLFCGYMTFIYLPWDIFIKPLSEDQEVWFGLLFTGWAAKLGGVLHWFVYGAGFWGFWKMRSWLFPWAALYSAQIAIGMFVWSYLDGRGGGLLVGVLVAIPFMVLTVTLWRTPHFKNSDSPAEEATSE